MDYSWCDEEEKCPKCGFIACKKCSKEYDKVDIELKKKGDE